MRFVALTLIVFARNKNGLKKCRDENVLSPLTSYPHILLQQCTTLLQYPNSTNFRSDYQWGACTIFCGQRRLTVSINRLLVYFMVACNGYRYTYFTLYCCGQHRSMYRITSLLPPTLAIDGCFPQPIAADNISR